MAEDAYAPYAQLVDTLATLSINIDPSPYPVQISLSVAVGLATLALFLWRRTRHQREKPLKFDVLFPEESQPNWKGKRLSPPNIRQQDDPAHIYAYCPATTQYLGKFKSDSREDIDNAMARAREAQTQFYSDPAFASKRRLFLTTLSAFILRNQAAIARVACRDSGKTMVDASMGEIMVTLEKIAWLLSHGERVLSPSSRPGPANMLMKYKKAQVWYEPLGVVGAVVSWNYPFHNMLGPIVAAVFAGNGVVVKCSERVRWSSGFFLDVVRGALKRSGISEDLVQLVCCWPEDADNVSGHPGLDHLTFIGSRPVAKHVVGKASEVLMPVVVELGGKDAVVICEDYLRAKGVDSIASILMRGTFQSAGQNCIGIERIVVCGDKANYDKLVSVLQTRVAALRLGSDIDQSEEIDVGAMIMGDGKFDELEAWIENVTSTGQAKLLAGGKRYIHPNYPQGHFFQPTLLADVDPQCKIAQCEVFGPVMSIIHAESDDAGIAIANGSEFGLGGSVYTTDRTKAFALAKRMHTGNVAINDFATFYVCQLPFGGVKGSGYGKFGGEEGLRGLCVEKSVCYDRLSMISTGIPPPIDYPIQDGKAAWKFVESLNRAGYDTSLYGKLKGIYRLARGGK